MKSASVSAPLGNIYPCLPVRGLGRADCRGADTGAIYAPITTLLATARSYLGSAEWSEIETWLITREPNWRQATEVSY